jgi:prepilin-type N-terminal cleavage/methylation domain-containing protein
MNPVLHRLPLRPRRSGFSLLELSTAMSLMLILGSSLVVMLQQHVTFMNLAQRQSFLASEAPKIGNLIGRIFNQADHYFIYATHDDALAGAAPVLAGGRAVRLFFRSADQTTESRVISAQPVTGGVALRFHHNLPAGGTFAWDISSLLQDATFAADQGILTLTLFGPNGEQITYGGGAR